MLGEKIMNLRKQKHWSQEELANRLEISRQAVSKWESGQSVPDLERIIQLSELFDVTTDYLLRQQPEKKNHSTGEQKKDWVDKLAYIAKTKGYLLGWLLVAWGVMDLLGLAAILLTVGGFFHLAF